MVQLKDYIKVNRNLLSPELLGTSIGDRYFFFLKTIKIFGGSVFI